MTEICPKGNTKTIVRTLCGMVMAIAFLSPLLKLDIPSYSMNMAKYRLEGEKIAEEGKEYGNSYSRTIIEEECRAYILDKGQLLGADIEDARVRLKWSSDGFWYPIGCSLSGQYNESLAGIIESELGIAEENQKWGTNEGA